MPRPLAQRKKEAKTPQAKNAPGSSRCFGMVRKYRKQERVSDPLGNRKTPHGERLPSPPESAAAPTA